jgi:hypothetical protein
MMMSRRVLVILLLAATAAGFFMLGVFHAQAEDAVERATYEARLDAIQAQVRSALGRTDDRPTGTGGRARPVDERTQMVADIKRELQSEMGLLPLQLLRDRRSSFVELHATDNQGKSSYGTAGYLGRGYFITVKHAVIALDDSGSAAGRKIVSIRVLHDGREVPARVVDAGDADVEVHTGDWAIIRTRELSLPALTPNTDYAWDFADPIFRLGNDYSKGIILSTGYVGQRMSTGLVSCLTDGHPGVSGGGVLDQRGDLVGIPIGRMQGDYRFSFILPIRTEMLRKLKPAA